MVDKFTNHENFVLFKERDVGNHYLFKFNNGYGASVVGISYLLGCSNSPWELAVIKFEAVNSYTIDYDTSITDDTISYLNEDEVLKILEEIKQLEESK